MKLQNLSKAVCKNRVFKYLLDKYDSGDDNNNDVNRINNVNYNNNNLIYRNNRNNNNYHGIHQGWRTGIVHASRWDN